MKQLWAPWRIEFIEGNKEESCIFCPPSIDKNADGLVLYRGPLSSVVLNKYPYNSGHILVSPTTHTDDLGALSDDEQLQMMKLIVRSKRALTEEMAPEGFNVGMNIGRAAGAGITEHLHWHVVPRWNGDVNFMPIMSETRVIPEHLKKTAERLRPYFDDLD